MAITHLLVDGFRNLENDRISLNSDFNVIVGDNGSGKSSFLEALFFLGHGKSFRTSNYLRLIKHNHQQFALNVATNNDKSLGVVKTNNGDTFIKIDGEKRYRLSELAENIAIQIITPESFKVFFGGPRERRKFIDLGMFHVKHSFSQLWKEFNTVLKQRNACLKAKLSTEQIAYWTESFTQLSEQITELRSDYIENLSCELNVWLNILLPDLNDQVRLHFLRGWTRSKELSEVLSFNQVKEYEKCTSLYGAHKFDLRFVINNVAIEQVLSRGQQKLFLLALTFAQAKLIERVKRVKPIIMIDDIGAELDTNSRKVLLQACQMLNCQTIITAIERSILEPILPKDKNYKMFHVKHGQISAIDE